MSDETDPTTPAWPDLQAWLGEAGNLVEVVEASEADGVAALAALEGVDETSALGALARHVASVVVDDWLVLLGAGGPGQPGLDAFNGRGAGAVDAIPGALVVAVDRLGGAFAVNAGGLPEGEIGEVAYLAPDDLTWMRCDFTYAGLLEFALEGDVEGFYADLRWPSWREEAAALGAGRGFNSFPPPWSEGAEAVPVQRVPAPLPEVWTTVLATSITTATWTPGAQA